MESIGTILHQCMVQLNLVLHGGQEGFCLVVDWVQNIVRGGTT